MSSFNAPPALEALVTHLMPGARLVEVRPLAADVEREGPTAKAGGYGRPLALVVDREGRRETLVFRLAVSDEFGHDRRADRAAAMLLDYDTFASIPRHVTVLDVGAMAADGRLVSLRDCGEPYLVTSWAPGVPYAQDLRRVADRGASAIDVDRCDALTRYLVDLHAQRHADPAAYRRAIRDLLGHGEGIFGMVDGFAAGVPGAPPQRLRDIERRCLEWRWRLRDRTARLARTHGDFHPFNVVFREGCDFTLLDTSRGSRGDPADDVTCMAINYAFFALQATAVGRQALGQLWGRFWTTYLEASGDAELLEVAAPFLAWRGLVLASPRFYPGLSAGARDAILTLAERALDRPRFDPGAADELFR